ncbi:hypothetical protein [Deinococcus navajonensis]|uniref:Uncharacterized protein n=1 Tax=Deinococcus navajonensis TaxID=309884 RepID=A0ABV8XSU6_9DEIO
MFGLFGKKKAEPHLRKDVEVGEMRVTAGHGLRLLAELDPVFENVVKGTELPNLEFTFRGIRISAPFADNVFGLNLLTTVEECNIHSCTTTDEKAFAYRCIDRVCFTCAGVRAFFDPVTGALTIAVQSAGFGEQYRADTLIDVALFMLEEGVMEARRYLGMPYTEAERPRVNQWMGGFHYGEGFRVYPTSTDAFAKFMEKKYQAQEVSRDETSILLKSGPVQYDVRFFGWRFGYMVSSATRGFKHAFQNDEHYVQIQERLAQPTTTQDPISDLEWNFRDPGRSTIAYFQPDGIFVLGEYGFGNTDTDQNGKAFDRVAGAQMVNVKFMTYLAESLPENLYADEANRPN